ncbi:phage holin family protein [Bacillus cereus group sp. BfR-BA-01538]|uniref:phage holin family protein n=1 Tax=Bacillus cereus group sp. BfR-BA-01538 TaxID=2920373 RepID=UPI001F592239
MDFNQKGTIKQKEVSPFPEENSTRVSAKNISNIVIAAGLFLSYYSNSISRPCSPINQLNNEIDGIIKKIDGLPSSNREFNFISHHQTLDNTLSKKTKNLNLNTGTQSLYTEISFSQGAGKTSSLISMTERLSKEHSNIIIFDTNFGHQEHHTVKLIGQENHTSMQDHNYILLSNDMLKYKQDFTKNSASNDNLFNKIVNKVLKNGGDGMRNVAAGFPIVEFKEVKKSWDNFTDAPSIKLTFTVVGSILTLLLGTFSTLHWVLLIMTVIHFLMRHVANKYQGNDSYVTFSRNIQLFLWPYILLVVINTLSKIISFDGLPDGTFFALGACWLIWGELKGIIENAETANLPVPPILKKMVSNNSNDQDIPF